MAIVRALWFGLPGTEGANWGAGYDVERMAMNGDALACLSGSRDAKRYRGATQLVCLILFCQSR